MEIPNDERTMTPLGVLSELRLDDIDTQKSLLSFDKHQVLEGAVFEDFFDREIAAYPPFADRFHTVYADTAIVSKRSGGYAALVLVERSGAGLGRYFLRLLSVMPVWYVRYDEERREFLASRVVRNGGEDSKLRPVLFASDIRPITAVLRSFGSDRPRGYDVALAVRDAHRQNAAYWGGIFPSSDTGKARRLTIARVFFNFAVTPHFGYVWNVDKVFADDTHVWSFEVKHKFPFWDSKAGKLGFGLNNGEVRNMQIQASAGIRNMHVVVVKPVWSKDYSTQVLFTESAHFKHTVILGREIDGAAAARALKETGGVSGEHTSLEGRSKQKFKTFHVDGFSNIGLKSDDGAALSERLVSLMDGTLRTAASDSHLRAHRLQVH
jgi:hypothetical protein